MFIEPPPDEPPPLLPVPPFIPFAVISPLLYRFVAYSINNPPVPFCPFPSAQSAAEVCPENVFFPAPPEFPAPPPAYLDVQLLDPLYDDAFPPFPPIWLCIFC